MTTPEATLAAVDNCSGLASWIGKRAKNGKGMRLRVLDRGVCLAEFYVPLVNAETHSEDVEGKVLLLYAGKFIPVTGERQQSALFFARRGLGSI